MATTVTPAVSNSIGLASRYLPILDEIYKADSKTAIKEQAKALLMMELERGTKSAKEEGWISEEEMWKEFGDTV